MTQSQFPYEGSGSFTPLPSHQARGGFIHSFARTARAVWPVWRDSARKEVKFQPLPKKKAVRLYHEARRFERQTRAAAPKGCQDGALGRNGLAVLHALIFDFLNFATGELFPSIASIAHAANISPRSVSRGLAKLKASGVVNWLRRCAEDWQDGRFILRQETNAYGILPASQWRDYAPEPPPPAPTGDTWGATPPLPDAITLACHEAAQGLPAMARELEQDERDPLAASLARLGRALGFKG
jgi:hypothetical protein